MYKYAVTFAKSGQVRYTSHLDMLRLFKRAFRRSGIEIKYSQGFNPHPKMGFAQPLSLGYGAEGEILEIETEEPVSGRRIREDLSRHLPEGVTIISAGRIGDGQKSMAASVNGAVYTIDYPIPYDAVNMDAVIAAYLMQPQILAMKKQKKSKELKETDIKEKIRDLKAEKNADGNIRIILTADCGSPSNLSPELFLQTFNEFASINCRRHEIDVCRVKLLLPLDYRVKEL